MLDAIMKNRNLMTIDKVPRETIHKLSLRRFIDRVESEIQSGCSERTLPHIWTRHFPDSAQLLHLSLDRHKSLCDLGSGAGFPGLVLSRSWRNGRASMLDRGTKKKADFLKRH